MLDGSLGIVQNISTVPAGNHLHRTVANNVNSQPKAVQLQANSATRLVIEKAALNRDHHRVRAIVCLQLCKDVFHMPFNRVFRDK